MNKAELQIGALLKQNLELGEQIKKLTALNAQLVKQNDN